MGAGCGAVVDGFGDFGFDGGDLGWGIVKKMEVRLDEKKMRVMMVGRQIKQERQ